AHDGPALCVERPAEGRRELGQFGSEPRERFGQNELPKSVPCAVDFSLADTEFCRLPSLPGLNGQGGEPLEGLGVAGWGLKQGGYLAALKSALVGAGGQPCSQRVDRASVEPLGR